MAKPKPKPIPIVELQEVLRYEPDTGRFYWRVRPSPTSRARAGDEAGSSERPYRRVMVKKEHYSLHRLAFAFTYGWAPESVDHRDGDTWNNTADNLREATDRQQQQNKASLGVSKAPGRKYRKADGTVVIYQRTKGFQSGIRVNGKKVWLGNFETMQEARDAYRKAAAEHFGEFARGAWRLPSVCP